MEVKTDILREMNEKLSAIVGMLGEDFANDSPERFMALELMAYLYDQINKARDEGKKLAWINYAVASEIFWAMDIPPVFLDGIAGSSASTPEVSIPYIDAAEAEIPDYICAVNKIFLGALIAGDLPTPDMLVVPSHPCDSNLATYPVIAERFGFPYFCIDAPYFKDDRGMEHVFSEMKRLVAFLEEQTGRKLKYEKLKKAMEYSNITHEYVLKIAKLAENVPAPFSGLDGLTDYGTVLCMAGTPELAEYMEKKYNAVKERQERGKGQSHNEKLRFVWIYGAPVFDYSLFDYLEQEYGARSVANMNNNFIMGPVKDLSSTDSILMGLASKIVKLPMGRECGGPWEDYVDAMVDLCSRMKGDAAIFAGHVACKANWPIMKLVKDRIQEELGIPTMMFELDLMDPRVTNMETIKAQFDDFMSIHFPDAAGGE